MLYTNLRHIESATDYAKVISENENVVLICGDMGHLSVKIYNLAESLVKNYKHIKFFDFEINNPESYVIQSLLPINEAEIPFIIFFKKGIPVYITNGNPLKDQLKKIFDTNFGTKNKNLKDTSILSE